MGGSVTILLNELAGGDRGALDRLVPLVYAELRRIAQAQLRSERPRHTLQPTALVHEAYARMAGPRATQRRGPRALSRHRGAYHAQSVDRSCVYT